MVFITEMKSVYSAVRTGSLYKAVLQQKMIGFYNRDEKFLQSGTDWVYKLSGLRFGFNGLTNLSIFKRFTNLSLEG